MAASPQRLRAQTASVSTLRMYQSFALWGKHLLVHICSSRLTKDQAKTPETAVMFLSLYQTNKLACTNSRKMMSKPRRANHGSAGWRLQYHQLSAFDLMRRHHPPLLFVANNAHANSLPTCPIQNIHPPPPTLQHPQSHLHPRSTLPAIHCAATCYTCATIHSCRNRSLQLPGSDH